MCFVLIEGGMVVQKQPYLDRGFVEAPDDVVCGWLWDGFAFLPPRPPTKSPEEIQAEIVTSTQQRLDDFARTRKYDGILSLCTYATSTNHAFAKEGQYGVNMRDATWAKLYEMLAEVEAGTRPMPTGYADIELELPILDWANA